MPKIDLWWHNLKAGDKVFVPMGRNKQSGMAEVYSNGKKYIHASLNGTPVRIRKDSGCVDQYPNFQVCRDEEDRMDSVKQRGEFRDAVEDLNALVRIHGFRITAEHVTKIRAVYDDMIGKGG